MAHLSLIWDEKSGRFFAVLRTPPRSWLPFLERMGFKNLTQRIGIPGARPLEQTGGRAWQDSGGVHEGGKKEDPPMDCMGEGEKGRHAHARLSKLPPQTPQITSFIVINDGGNK